MKRFFIFFFALVATTALWAEDFCVDRIYYNILTDKTNEVEVTYGSSGYSGSITIPSTVTYNGTTYSVTTIGDAAFSWCSSLTSITIPNSVKSIEGYAFSGCSGLTSVTLPDSLTSIGERAFSNCSSLADITIGNSVTSIGERAFSYCSSLTSVTIPNSVTSIGDESFAYCSSLANITIGNSVTSIGKRAFYRCSSITSIAIPKNIMVLKIFQGCSNLTDIQYVNGIDTLTAIDKHTFGGAKFPVCIIPNNVVSIGYGAFNKSKNLHTITIPVSVKSMDAYAFYSCKSLSTIIYEGTVEQWQQIVKHKKWSKGIGSFVVECVDKELIENERSA